MALSGNVKASINLTQTSVGDLGTATLPLSIAASLAFAFGTATGQINVLFSDTRTLVATSENLDVAGVLADAYGATVAMARGKVIYVRNTHASASLLLGGAASNAWAAMFGDATDILKVAPGGFILLAAPLATGYAVTAATGDILKIDAGASTIVYDIALIGCNA